MRVGQHSWSCIARDVLLAVYCADVKSGEIIEFVDEEIENLQKKVAEKYGYTLVDHKLELYGVKKSKK